VHEVLQCPALASLAGVYPQGLRTRAVREELDALRQRLRKGEQTDGTWTLEEIVVGALTRLQRLGRPRLRRVINATGILLHTNLGRAPLAEAAARAVYETARGYVNLELDLESGRRAHRQETVRDWLVHLTGAPSATVVNNNAAATMLVLHALAYRREVVVSRGQLVEIGGSFRIPEIMRASGAKLREVGTTNITRLADYEGAIGPRTAALLRVHTSNYRIRGHTESVALADLVQLAHARGLYAIDDIGSGALIDYAPLGLAGEPLVRDSLAAGADLVLFSGDKLLGGPQAGIVLGREHLIARLEKDPLYRAFRVDKMTLAALEATLRLYLDPQRLARELPLLVRVQTPVAELRRRAEMLAYSLESLPGVQVQVAASEAYVGGGSLPEQALPSVAVVLAVEGMSAQELARKLRSSDPPVVARVHAEHVWLDVRAVAPEEDAWITQALRQILPAR